MREVNTMPCCTPDGEWSGIARLVFGDTENGRVTAPTSHHSIAPGATVHRCTDHRQPPHFSTIPNPHRQ